MVTGGWSGNLYSVPERGGELTIFLEPRREEGELKYQTASFLPDGEGLLFTITRGEGEFDVVSWRNGTLQTLVRESTEVTRPIAMGPMVVYERKGGVDLSELRAIPLVPSESHPSSIRIQAGSTAPSADVHGSLVFGRINPQPEQLAWVDRTGTILAKIGPLLDSIDDPLVSPDGRYLVFNSSGDSGRFGIWAYDLQRGSTALLADGGAALGPSSDGEYVFFSPDADKLTRRVAVLGSGENEPIGIAAKGAYAPDQSPDGESIVYYLVDPTTQRDLHVFSASTGESTPFRVSPNNEALPQVSPGGGWLAYQSDESGHWEVYVERFPEGGGRAQVSSGGGQTPRWSPRGDELFFVADSALMVVSFAGEEEAQVGRPEIVFRADAIGTRLVLARRYFSHFYDVGPDAKKFLVVLGVAQGTNEIVFAENALAGLEEEP